MLRILKPKLKRYGWNIMIGLDQLLNVFLGGYPDETLSSRVHRKAESGQWFWIILRFIINGIFFWQNDHCRASYQSERNLQHSPQYAYQSGERVALDDEEKASGSLLRPIMRYLLLTPISLLLSLLNYFLAPIVVLFADSEGWLPDYLRWFQTPDNSLEGDNGWKAEHRWFKNHLKADHGWRRWINRFHWLWRNSMHGFEQEILGFTPEPGFSYHSQGNEQISNRPLVNGLVVRTVTNPDGKTAFQFYFVWAWSLKYCLRINLGWKIWQKPKAGKACQHVVSINPFMGWS